MGNIIHKPPEQRRPPRFYPPKAPVQGLPLYWQLQHGPLPGDPNTLADYHEWFRNFFNYLEGRLDTSHSRYKRLRNLSRIKGADVVYRRLRCEFVARQGLYPLYYLWPKMADQLLMNYRKLVANSCEDEEQWAFFKSQCIEVLTRIEDRPAYDGHSSEDRPAYDGHPIEEALLPLVGPRLLATALYSTTHVSDVSPAAVYESLRNDILDTQLFGQSSSRLQVPFSHHNGRHRWVFNQAKTSGDMLDLIESQVLVIPS